MALRSVAAFSAPADPEEEAADEDPSSWGQARLDRVLEALTPPFELAGEDAPSYGRAQHVAADGLRFTIALGYAPDEGRDWLLFVHGKPDRPVPDSESSRALVAQVHRALTAQEDVKGVKWSDRRSFDANQADWKPAPLD